MFLRVLLCLLPVLSLAGASVARRTVAYHEANVKLFRRDGVYDYSTMLLREDLGVLVVGARDVLYALDMHDVTVERGTVNWPVNDREQKDCTSKGKKESECHNYIRVLHKAEDGRMYVCGTNAFSPNCDYMTYDGGTLSLQKESQDGKGKCPFDPLQRYASLMIGGDLYSATYSTFTGSEWLLQRSFSTPLRTVHQIAWLNEPQFVALEYIPESQDSPDGDDDKVYLFFSEVAEEYDFYKKMKVSRVARVCRGDLGGQRTLQKKWTSFLKTQLNCPVSEFILPYIIQDVFLWRHADWRKSIFYAVFTPQSGEGASLSAVCAYSISYIGNIFSQGKYKTPITVETTHKWVTYSGEVPSPRPGACINDDARKQNINRSLDLPDRTLQFVQNRPLMDQPVQPISGRPILTSSGPAFSRIVVDSVVAIDGGTYNVMFIGTENGTLHKAVNYDSEMVIIEDVQLFPEPQPIQILRLSVSTGQLYAGSVNAVIQVPLSSCSRYTSCHHCVLARDPYCAWDSERDVCTALNRLSSAPQASLIQSVVDGNAHLCPKAAQLEPQNLTVPYGRSIKLPCHPQSNLADVHWRFEDQPAVPSQGIRMSPDGLEVGEASPGHEGVYECQSVERVKGRAYTATLASYRLVLAEGEEVPDPPEALRDTQGLLPLQVAVGLLSVLLVVLVVWNLYHGHIPLPGRGRTGDAGRPPAPTQQAECKPLALESNANNNNHTSFSQPARVSLNLPGISHIHDESEI